VKGIPTIVRKINEDLISDDFDIYSNASCTTNCLAPLVKVILEEWGMKRGFMSTVHAYTGNQRLQDAPHKDLRRARAAAVNMVPTTTGAAKALELVIPEAKGLITASSIRVPVITGSLVELIAELPQEIDLETANAAFKKAAEGDLRGVLEYSEAPLVSSDIIGNSHSSIFDAPLTSVNGPLLKVTAWYDNEAGYAARLAEMAELI
jgi:glyceraldehyde 3-phosphate dehydrogenase